MLWVLIPLPIVYYVQLPAEYLLPCMPAVILLCFRLMEVCSARVARAAAIALIVGGVGYSLLILRSDAEFARFGRDSMYRLIEPHVAAGERYGSARSSQLIGMRPWPEQRLRSLAALSQDPEICWIVRASTEGGLTLARFPHRTFVNAISHKYRFGRTWGAGIGLYTNWEGQAYWLWGFGEVGRPVRELWRIDSNAAAASGASAWYTPQQKCWHAPAGVCRRPVRDRSAAHYLVRIKSSQAC